ncbi:hypothetical protein Tco_0924468 [Tanacetum coccineum]|uniref:Uncharacterized protein n=1 Tax=Tanacetum coccineum TaxID=301880 RepID=A0ABQ5DA94_9ASTR
MWAGERGEGVVWGWWSGWGWGLGHVVGGGRGWWGRHGGGSGGVAEVSLVVLGSDFGGGGAGVKGLGGSGAGGEDGGGLGWCGGRLVWEAGWGGVEAGRYLGWGGGLGSGVGFGLEGWDGVVGAKVVVGGSCYSAVGGGRWLGAGILAIKAIITLRLTEGTASGDVIAAGALKEVAKSPDISSFLAFHLTQIDSFMKTMIWWSW